MSATEHTNTTPDGYAGPPSRPPVAITGVAFDSLTLDEALARIERMIALRRPQYVVTANVDFVVQARWDVELHRILCDAPLVLCDGTPLVWASRWLGNRLPERVAGADIVPRLIEVATQKRYRLFFLGASPESANAAVARLRSRYPDLLIVGHYSPPFKQLLEMDHQEIRRRIRSAKPDLLLVSLGCPKQEKWLAMHYRDLNVPVAIGVGATIDFLAGQVRRAPMWMRKTGTEWLFRLGQEPRRLFRRYAKDLGVFAWCLLAQTYLNRKLNRNHRNREPDLNHDPAANAAVSGDATPFQVVRLGHSLTFAAATEILLCLGNALVEGRNCLLDGSGVRAVDSTGMALLLNFRRNAGALGLKVVLVFPSRPLARMLRWMHLNEVFLVAPDLESAALELNDTHTRSSASKAPLRGPLEWAGEITAANIAAIWEPARAYLAMLPPLTRCVLDLSKVRFIDSSGLGLMIRAKKFARAQQKEIVFTNPGPAVRNVIRLARLESFLLSAAEPVATMAAAERIALKSSN